MDPPTAASVTWVPVGTLSRLLLALLIGLFVGLEREWRGKEAGLRTFGLVGLLGGIAGLLDLPTALATLALTALLVVFLNVQSMRAEQGTELTTSAAMFVTCLCGVLCGKGHIITPVATGVVSAWLLSAKERLAGFSHGLSAKELRAAILLGVLAFGIYPVLPAHAVDPWGLIAPRAAWITVLLIAAMGFANYLLWKVFGTRGVELAGFLGGLVNSTVIVTELSTRSRESDGALDGVAYRGVILSTAAMAVRNAAVLAFLSLGAFHAVLIPIGAMFLASVLLAWRAKTQAVTDTPPPMKLESPFELKSAIKFGVVFLALQVGGNIAQSMLGRFGFYAVSAVGGLISSASAVASAGSLAASGRLTPLVAGTGAVLASIASAFINIVIVSRVSKSRPLVRRVVTAMAAVLVATVLGGAAAYYRV